MRKTKLLIIFLTVILVILLLLVIIFNKNRSPLPQLPTTPSVTPLPSQVTTESLYPTPISKDLKIIEVKPAQDISRQFLPIQQVSFVFNDNVQRDGIFVNIDPYVPAEFLIRADRPNTITISPIDDWKEGITIITVKEMTTSVNGKSLASPYTYKLNTAFPKNVDFRGP